MRISYDKEKLQKIIEDFSKITGIDISVLDSKLNLIAHYNNSYEFCKTVQKITTGIEKCRCSDMELFDLCKKDLNSQRHICHAGLVDITIPILKNSTPVAFLLLGRIRNTESFSNIFNRIDWLKKDYSILEKEFLNLKFFSETQIESLIDILTSITKLILDENLIKTEHNELAERIDEFIDENLFKKLTIEVLCKELCVSKNMLYNIFRYELNSTVNNYISLKRLEKVKYLLKNSSLSLSEIQEKCGIGSYTYFFKLVKENTGMTPNEYRKLRL